MKNRQTISFFLLIMFFFVEVYSQNSTNNYLQEKINNLKSGEILIIPDGTYDDLKLKIYNKNDIIIQANTNGKVIIKNNSSIIVDNSQNISVKGFKFEETLSENVIFINQSKRILVENNYFFKCMGGENNAAVTIKNKSEDIVVKNNTFDDLRTMAVKVNYDYSKRTIITKNLFANIQGTKAIYPDSNGNGMESIGIGTGKDWNWKGYAEIYENKFINIIGDESEIICLKSDNNKVYSNFFENCEGGISLRVGNNNSVSHNNFINTKYPIRVFGQNHKIDNNYILGGYFGIQLPAADTDVGDSPKKAPYFRSKNIEINNNTIINTNIPVVIGRMGKAKRNKSPENIKFINNNFDKIGWLTIENSETNSIKILDNKIKAKKIDFKQPIKFGVVWK